MNEDFPYHQTFVNESESLHEYLGIKSPVHPELMKEFDKIVHDSAATQRTLNRFFIDATWFFSLKYSI